MSPGTRVEKLQGGFGFLEGTCWMPGGYLLFSDEGPGRSTIFEWSDTGGLTPFRPHDNCTNGNTVDRRGRLVSCEQDARAVTRTEPDGAVANGRTLCQTDHGVPDGFRVDAAGRIWSSGGDGVQVFAADGARIGRIPVPESPANLCFGRADGHTLFIAARTGLYRIPVWVAAAHPR